MLYFVNHHQTAKTTVPTTAVMAVEINNESAASLIQSVTVMISSRLNYRVRYERLTSNVSHGSSGDPPTSASRMLWGCLVRLSPMLPHVWLLSGRS